MIWSSDSKFDKLLEAREIYRLEGLKGVQDLQAILKDICNYDTIEEFLADNPAMCEQIIEFVQEWTNRNHEWQARLDQQLEEIDNRDHDQ